MHQDNSLIQMANEDGEDGTRQPEVLDTKQDTKLPANYCLSSAIELINCVVS